MSGNDMLIATKEAFGEPILFETFRYLREGVSQNAYYAIFKKPEDTNV